MASKVKITKRLRELKKQFIVPHEHCAGSVHRADWAWHHTIIDGPNEESIVIVRSCRSCGRREMAVVGSTAWQKARGDYALDEHYE